jgi:hypothetical protein
MKPPPLRVKNPMLKKMTQKKNPLETNSTVDDRERRKQLRCDRCKPHKGENKTYTKRGVQKPKGKNKRR